MGSVRLPTSPDPGRHSPAVAIAAADAVVAYTARRTRAVVAFSIVLGIVLIAVCTPFQTATSVSRTTASVSTTVSGSWDQISKWSAPYLSGSSDPALDDERLGDGGDGDDGDGDGDDDYYAKPGLTQIDKTQRGVHRRVRYIPMEALDELVANNKTGLEGDVHLGDGFDELQKYANALEGKSSSAVEELQYINNKTVLIIGDSVDRFALDGMCRSIFKGDLSYRNLHKSSIGILDKITNPDGQYDEFSEPHLCRITSSKTRGKFDGFDVWSLMIYGVVAGKDEWKHKDQTRHPRLWNEKIDLFAGAMAAQGKKPDLIIMNSLLWDLATFNIRDAIAEVPAKDLLDLKDVEQFEQQTFAFLDKVNEHWPDAVKMYRKQHAGKPTPGTWYLHGLKPMPKSIAREPYSYNKVLQLNNVVESIVASTIKEHKADSPSLALHAFDIKHASQDYIKDFQDGVHPGDTGKILYTQMLMYYVKKYLS